MKTFAILQARMTSTRFPGKVLRRVQGRSVLDWVIRSTGATAGIDGVCVAVPTGAAHEPVVEEALQCGARVTRGSENDVLERFSVAAEACNAGAIMRVTTDCPLTDPAINAQVISLFRGAGVDYACNNEPFGYPHGLDCEVFTRNVLERARSEATESYDREHVTPWIKRHASVRRAYLQGPGGPWTAWRWTVDFPEDFAFFQAVVEELGDSASDSAKVCELLRRRPELLEINYHRRQR